MKFDYRHPVLNHSGSRIQSHFLPRRDQSLFITKELFKELKGFDENLSFMRTMKLFLGFTPKQFVVIPDYIITWLEGCINKCNLYHFTVIHLKRVLGHSVKR
jgi:hypothetical protein